MILATAVIWLSLDQSVAAQQGGVANYFYDGNGRLTAVLSPTGEAAIYNYDPAGNFTSITRRAANELSIIDFTPGTGAAQITISPTAALGPRTITTTTGSEVVSGVDAFTVNASPAPGAASSTVSTLAGSAGNPGFVDGTGSVARFRSLAGLAAAANDEVIIADAGNHAIRRVTNTGAVTTIAGAGFPGFYDDQGTFAEFNNPQGVAVDASRTSTSPTPATTASAKLTPAAM